MMFDAFITTLGVFAAVITGVVSLMMLKVFSDYLKYKSYMNKKEKK